MLRTNTRSLEGTHGSSVGTYELEGLGYHVFGCKHVGLLRKSTTKTLGPFRLCLATLGSRYEAGESSTRGQGVDYGFTDTVEAKMRHRGIREVGYGIRDTWIDPAEAVPDMASTTLEKVNTRVIELAELHEHNT
nr:hypothetical protein [Tanacetum cinerariifolium]